MRVAGFMRPERGVSRNAGGFASMRSALAALGVFGLTLMPGLVIGHLVQWVYAFLIAGPFR